MHKGFIKAKELYYNKEADWTYVKFYVDEICKNGTPYVDFAHFCILNGLIYLLENPENPKEKVYFKVDLCELILSKDQEKNEKVFKMLKKYDIPNTYSEEDIDEWFEKNIYN